MRHYGGVLAGGHVTVTRGVAEGTTSRRAPYYSLLPARLARGRFLNWLRLTHAWLGLWGVTLGVLFGATGILMNHRAVMKIPAGKHEQKIMQISVPQPALTDVDRFATWLQRELAISKPPARKKADPPRRVVWAGQAVSQPGRWEVSFAAPRYLITAEYWVGNSFATVKRSDANLWAFLMGLHMANGVSVGWILLADSIAASFIVLALTGILLWTRLHGPRLLAAGLALGSLLFGIGLAWTSL